MAELITTALPHKEWAMNQPSQTIRPTTDADEAYGSMAAIGHREATLKLVNHRELQMRPGMAIDQQQHVEVEAWRQIGEYFVKFVPETVQRQITANLEAPDLSMRECDVSVLFVDISGYSCLSERLSPDALNTLVERYFSTFLDCMYEAGGDINEIAGDGLMAIFQSASPRQHAVSAAAAALAIL